MSEDSDRLDEISDAEAEAFMARQAVTFLECAINLMAHSFTPDEVANILRWQAENVVDVV